MPTDLPGFEVRGGDATHEHEWENPRFNANSPIGLVAVCRCGAQSIKLPSPRRGLERLDWLLGQWEFPEGVPPPVDAPRYLMLGESRTQIEVAAALIEELHDWLGKRR